MRWIDRALGVLACGLAALAATAQQAPPAPNQARYLVVVDAAHGGSDLGAHLANGKWEKDVTLAVSARLRSLLAARGIAVVTTRESDAETPADKRAEIANRATAQACISLHITETGSGIHIYTSSLAPAPQQRFAAWKTAQAAWVPRSLALAGVLNSALAHAGIKVTLGRTTLPGVDSMTCPVVVVEVAPDHDPDKGTISGPDDPGYQARVAAALAAALLEWRTEAHQP